MARPRKAGLEYFYKDVHDWDDFRIIDLVNRFGPSGFAVYDVVLCEIYKNGYYLETPLEKLTLFVIRAIGSRWIKDKSFVLQVLQYCAEIGLFDDALLSQSVITSAEIQTHYSEVTARSKADKSKYWLLGEPEKKDSPAVLINAPEKKVFATETPVFVAKTPVNDANMHQSKTNKNKSNKSKAAAYADGMNSSITAAGSQIEDTFFEMTGRRFTPSDVTALQEMTGSGATEELILGLMGNVAKRRQSITSMKYFIPIVREAMAKKVQRCEETYSTSDIEAILDAEWAMEMAKYAAGEKRRNAVDQH